MDAHRMKRLGCGLLAGLAVLAAAATTHAGDQYPGDAVCTTNADGSGQCFGSFNGFRISPGPGDYVEYNLVSAGSNPFGFFYANLGNQSYSCVAGQDVMPIWSSAMSNRSGFNIHWDSSATCDSLMVFNWSGFNPG